MGQALKGLTGCGVNPPHFLIEQRRASRDRTDYTEEITTFAGVGRTSTPFPGLSIYSNFGPTCPNGIPFISKLTKHSSLYGPERPTFDSESVIALLSRFGFLSVCSHKSRSY
jgi:hypothetical protein